MNWIKSNSISCFILLDSWLLSGFMKSTCCLILWFYQRHEVALSSNSWCCSMNHSHRDYLYPSHKHPMAAFLLNSFFRLYGSDGFEHIAVKMTFSQKHTLFDRVMTLSQLHKKARSQVPSLDLLFCSWCPYCLTNLIYLTCMVFFCSSCSMFIWLRGCLLA